jgi:hypothetical protein
MRAAGAVTANNGHGDRCDCALLARAMRMSPRAISFAFCHDVLQKRWRMTCLHGCRPAEVAPAVQRWQDLGEVDAVQAILISNEPSQQ